VVGDEEMMKLPEQLGKLLAVDPRRLGRRLIGLYQLPAYFDQ
jgi:hypothetical protein